MVLTVDCNSVAAGLFQTHLNKMHFINLWLWSALGRTVWSKIRCYICTRWLCISLEQITSISQRLWLGRRGTSEHWHCAHMAEFDERCSHSEHDTFYYIYTPRIEQQCRDMAHCRLLYIQKAFDYN